VVDFIVAFKPGVADPSLSKGRIGLQWDPMLMEEECSPRSGHDVLPAAQEPLAGLLRAPCQTLSSPHDVPPPGWFAAPDHAQQPVASVSSLCHADGETHHSVPIRSATPHASEMEAGATQEDDMARMQRLWRLSSCRLLLPCPDRCARSQLRSQLPQQSSRWLLPCLCRSRHFLRLIADDPRRHLR
jgi:hypothetical protein